MCGVQIMSVIYGGVIYRAEVVRVAGQPWVLLVDRNVLLPMANVTVLSRAA